MKLTNISLAILVAIGLVACGGSDDKNNPVPDPEPKPKPIPEDPKDPQDPKSGLIPERAAPDMTVPADIENIVATRKTIFVDRTFTDSALGYKSGTGFDYDADQGTNPENVRTTSTYNFKAQRDVVKVGVADIVESTAIDTAPDKNKVYTKESIGAIHVGVNPTLGTNNAFVKTKDGYVRVAVETLDGTNQYNQKTKFKEIKEVNPNGTVKTWGTEEHDQSEVVFIANAKTEAGDKFGLEKDGTNSLPLVLGKESINVGGSDALQYDSNANEVSLTKVKVFGETYDVGVNGQNIDFGKLPRKAEIQTQEVTGTYQIRNGKETGIGNDDFSVNKSIKLGNIKAYNLPYAIAFVTTNVDKDNPGAKNIFGIGAYNVVGFKTIALPKQGRALYSGKSFNASVEGDVELIADFFEDRAGVSGSILNRKDKDGNTLANLTLDEISLTSPQNHSTGGVAGVKGEPSYADAWTVNFYGQDAEEAAGRLYLGGFDDGKVNADAKVVEVYNTQRGKLTNKSNTADTK